MNHIFEPMQDIGIHGMPRASGDGIVCHVHPILMVYAGDYPKQVLVTGVKTRECPKCIAPNNDLGGINTLYTQCDLGKVLDALSLIDDYPLRYMQVCAEAGIKAIYSLF
jgi:hypothetical protein